MTVQAAYACAVAWGGGYCVTAYVGNVHFRRPIHSGDLVEVTAQLVLTGRSSMHVQVTVRAAPVATRVFTETTSCLVVFVAVGPDGRPSPVRPWTPPTPALALAEQDARARIVPARPGSLPARLLHRDLLLASRSVDHSSPIVPMPPRRGSGPFPSGAPTA